VAGDRRALTHKVYNFTAAQVGWLACVLGAAHGRPWSGSLVAALIVATHLVLARDRRTEWRLIVLVGAFGLCLDGALKASGLVAYSADPTAIAWLAPMWIVALWMLFASTLNGSLSWLRGRIALTALLGAVSGPLSYASGARLGAASFPRGTRAALLALSLLWAIAIPLLIRLAETVAGRRLGASVSGSTC
jgi:hypothetical protein